MRRLDSSEGTRPRHNGVPGLRRLRGTGTTSGHCATCPRARSRSRCSAPTRSVTERRLRSAELSAHHVDGDLAVLVSIVCGAGDPLPRLAVSVQ